MTIQRDYRGGVIVSAVLREQPEFSIIAACGVNYRETISDYRARVEVIELLQTEEPFDEVVRLAQRITQFPEFSLLGNANKSYLVVDNTDGSARMTELLGQIRRPNSMTIVLTVEREQRYHGGQYYVPRRDVIANLVDAFQGGRIEVAEELTLSGMLESELTNLTVRAANEASALVVAVAMLTWKAGENCPAGYFSEPAPYSDYDPLRWGLT